MAQQNQSRRTSGRSGGNGSARGSGRKDYVGNGGELHQVASGQIERMTTAQGIPVRDNQNSLRAGSRGPTLMQDFAMREKIFHFDHERIPERVVHARGYGARGTFVTTDPIPDVTRAHLFQKKNRRTEVFVRFSTVAGNLGSFDLARDVRGFAVKFYTQEGNWDLVGNNIPVFFIQDAIKFPDLVHAVKEEPDRGFPQAASAHDTFWDFVSLMPESTHMLMWQMSDRAIPRSWRFMEGFGVHTFRFINAEGADSFVKFHWKPRLGMQSVVWNEAVKINGADPDFHRRDLFESISNGDFPQWDLAVQIFDDEVADSFDFDILDPTKIIPEDVVPLRVIGTLTLDTLVENVFAGIEQAAFCTQNIVPGIDFTNDPLLQGRNFSYLDTQLKRLGSTNFTQIPVNAPRCPIAHLQRDGHMQMSTQPGRATYEPNSFTGTDGGPREDPDGGFPAYPEPVSGEHRQIRAESFADHYSQARLFLVSQTDVEREHMRDAFAFELGKCEIAAIRTRMLANLRNVDEDFAREVADALGMPLPAASEAAVATRTDLPAADELSILKNAKGTFKGRKLGILVTPGADAGLVGALREAVEKAKGTVQLIGPVVGPLSLSDGTEVTPDHALAAAPSVLFDAVSIIASEDGATFLADQPGARDFASDAFTHFKFIGYSPEATVLLDAAGVIPDEACTELAAKSARRFVRGLGALRHWGRDVGA